MPWNRGPRHRLYLQIYFALVGTLALFAVVADTVWRWTDDDWPRRSPYAIVKALVTAAIPAADVSRAQQQRVLERLAAETGGRFSLFAADGQLLAAAGAPLPAPTAGGASRRREHGRDVFSEPLPDGRWLVVEAPRSMRPPHLGPFAALVLIALAAYPAVRRLTRRLERLQTSVEALGAGDLTSRVPVEGRDEVARLAESFNRAAARIEALVTAHKALLANASHELRSPLTRLRLALELLPAGASTAQRAEVERNIAELDSLIDEILLASRLDAGPALERPEEIDLIGLAAEEAARLDLPVTGTAAPVRGDARLLRRLVRNLLDNAHRHGAAPIETAVTRSGGSVTLTVCDRGPGVPDAERERIFEPFYRLPGHREGSGGTGLGLAMVRQIAHQHGGEVGCEPRPGGGTCFRVTLPAAG